MIGKTAKNKKRPQILEKMNKVSIEKHFSQETLSQ